MDLKTYQQEATRTMANLGELVNDSIHMVIGMNTEVAAELLQPLMNTNTSIDTVNIKEEIGDLMWYIANYATLHKFSLTNKLGIKYEFEPTPLEVVLDMLIDIGELQDLDKKLYAYKKPYDDTKQHMYFFHLNQLVLKLCDIFKFDFESILETNINKLKARYPEKFNSNDAINRNLDKEREILEQ